jgi:hypothetical protein
MIVKILGSADILSSLVFLMLIFGMHPFIYLVMFCVAVLFLKGMFILSGNVLSLFDLIAAFLLVLSIFFAPPVFLLWICAFLLLAKGVVSFL